MKAEAKNRSRGTSLLEVLIAMAIMTFLVIGILQMFFVALNLSASSSTRTQLTYKAQQVAEQIRYLHYVAQQYGDAQIPSWASYLGQTMTQGSYPLPYTTSDLSGTSGTYWGPQGVNVIEGAQMPYKLSYTIADGQQTTGADLNTWVVTINAVPVQNSDSASQAGTNLYKQTTDLKQQKVQYVFSIKKP